MDPNANLKEQRELQEKLVRLWANGSRDEYDLCIIELAELAQAMDEWLSRGGAFPDSWKLWPRG